MDKSFRHQLFLQPALVLFSYQTPHHNATQRNHPPTASRRVAAQAAASFLPAGRDGFSNGIEGSTRATSQLDTGLKPLSLQQSIQGLLGRLHIPSLLSCRLQTPQKTARSLVFATTNCLPLCSLHAQDGQLFYIVRVEEQNQGLDNPSNPPCWCRSKCNSRTNEDRHLTCTSSWKRNQRGRGTEGTTTVRRGYGGLFTHDLTRDWSALNASTGCRGGDGRHRGCHFHRKLSEPRRQARPEAGESLCQSFKQSARKYGCDRSYHHHNSLHT